jgi:hypothetical protein
VDVPRWGLGGTPNLPTKKNPMTKDVISEIEALKALLSETADHQVLAEMLGFGAVRLLALDVDHLRK